MKTDKDLNWKKFFLRLTIILSNPIAFIIGVSIIPTYSGLEYLFVGILSAIFVWAIYFAIRWIVKGLHS